MNTFKFCKSKFVAASWTFINDKNRIELKSERSLRKTKLLEECNIKPIEKVKEKLRESEKKPKRIQDGEKKKKNIDTKPKDKK